MTATAQVGGAGEGRDHDDGVFVDVDEAACIQSGQCLVSLPELFRSEEGRTVAAPVGDVLIDAVIRTAKSCPTSAIRVWIRSEEIVT